MLCSVYLLGVGTSILRTGVLKNWAGFAALWITASALAVVIHAVGLGGLAWMGTELSASAAKDFSEAKQSQPLQVRLENREWPRDQVDGTAGPVADRSTVRPSAVSKAAFPSVRAEVAAASETVETPLPAPHQPELRANSLTESTLDIERCTHLATIVSRELWLEWRDYGILPRTYEVAYAVLEGGIIELVRFAPVHAQPLEYADRMLRNVLQHCIGDLVEVGHWSELGKPGTESDLEVTFVIGEERF